MDTKTKIILVRHGETDWNLEGKMQGRTDIPLNETGRNQARLLQKKLVDIDFTIAYSSTLHRAIETAQLAIQGRNIELKYSDKLVERDLGILEGTSWDAYAKELPYHLAHNTFIHYKHHPSMESFADVFTRVSKEIFKIAKEQPNETVLIASHGAVIKSFLLHLDESFPKDKTINNGAMLHCLVTNKGIDLQYFING
ncbi:MAG: histidine phosphatase family protein [Chlamydiae bacterium]|nr:histidine phosphatase family protein [Chlamydiota bacterium]